METKDGSDGFDFCDKYDKVILNELVEYTLTDGRKTITRFVHDGNSVSMTEIFEPETKTPLDVQKDFAICFEQF